MAISRFGAPSLIHPLKETGMPLLDVAGPLPRLTDDWPIAVVLLIIAVCLVVIVAWRQSRRR